MTQRHFTLQISIRLLMSHFSHLTPRATHRTPHTPQLIFIATYVTSPSSQLSPHPLTLHTCHLTSHLSHQTEATVTDKKQFQEVVTNVWKS